MKEEKHLISEGEKKTCQKKILSSTLAEKMEQTCCLVTPSVSKVYGSLPYESLILDRDLNKGGAGGAIAPPHFGRIEGAAGQRRHAALLLVPP